MGVILGFSLDEYHGFVIGFYPLKWGWWSYNKVTTPMEMVTLWIGPFCFIVTSGYHGTIE